jgi:WD40 repeat protein
MSTIKLWEVATGKEPCVLDRQGVGLSVAFSPDGRWLGATASTSPRPGQLDEKILLWKTDDIEALLRRHGAR